MFDDWHVVELYFETTNNHATLIGKYWISLFLVLRFLVLVAFAGDAFEPEKSSMVMVECDTNTPGCERMCTNHFYPILPTDFWALEMICISLPLCIALTYISHKTEKIQTAKKWIRKENKRRIAKEKQRIDDDKKVLARKRNTYSTWEQPNGQSLTNQQIEEILAAKEIEIEENEKQLEDEHSEDSEKATHPTTPKLFLAYVSMVCVRWLIEIFFLVAFFHLYVFQLTMPNTYKCDRSPCNEEVTCYIDRADKKTIAIHVMVGTSCVSIAIGFFEILYLFTKGSGGATEFCSAFSNRHQDITKTAKKMQQDSQLKLIL